VPDVVKVRARALTTSGTRHSWAIRGVVYVGSVSAAISTAPRLKPMGIGGSLANPTYITKITWPIKPRIVSLADTKISLARRSRNLLRSQMSPLGRDRVHVRLGAILIAVMISSVRAEPCQSHRFHPFSGVEFKVRLRVPYTGRKLVPRKLPGC